MTDATRSSPDGPRSASTGALVSQVAQQVSRLVRYELALARAELAPKAKRAGIGAGLFGAAGVFALYGVATLLVALVLGLAVVMPAWLAGLVVTTVLFVATAVLAVLGRRRVKRAMPLVPQETMRSVRADLDEVRARAQR
ncbi:MAG TPA: phage holin family protein [Catenuloplanes sp.]